MEMHRCKLCFRNFANGRALGGHMRSHVMNLYAAKNSSRKQKEEDDEEERQIPSGENFQENDEFQSVHSCSSSSEEDDGDDEERSPIFVDQEFSVVLQDGESEAESSKHYRFCRRSKRVRKSRLFYSDRLPMSEKIKSKYGEANDHSPMSSSISDTTPEEDVAYCLMMLSRDKWERENDYSGFAKVKRITKMRRGKYRCETCSKLFRSYQALGGHRASHKKYKVNEAAPPVGGGLAVVVVEEEKIHGCPLCHRVFASGQALGGHKRSHFIGAAAISGNISSDHKQYSRNGGILKIDLNRPAPVDDHDISH